MEKSNCANCGKEVEKKYKYCLDCMKKYKEEVTEYPVLNSNDTVNALNRIADILEKQNWNLGNILATLSGNTILKKKLEENKK